MDFLLRLFKSLANENRLKIIRFLLRTREAPIGSLASELKLPYKTVARNLKILEKAGLVRSRRWRGLVHYSLDTSPKLEYNRAMFGLIRMRSR